MYSVLQSPLKVLFLSWSNNFSFPFRGKPLAPTFPLWIMCFKWLLASLSCLFVSLLRGRVPLEGLVWRGMFPPEFGLDPWHVREGPLQACILQVDGWLFHRGPLEGWGKTSLLCNTVLGLVHPRDGWHSKQSEQQGAMWLSKLTSSCVFFSQYTERCLTRPLHNGVTAPEEHKVGGGSAFAW